MNKFSKITKSKVNQKPEIKEEEGDLEERTLKYTISKLINDFLKIRIEGPIDPILEGTIKIVGKDVFISAIVDLFKDKDVMDSLKVLQEAKFNGLDNNISKYENILNEHQSLSMLKKHDKRIDDIIRRADGDHDKAIEITQNQADKIKNGEKAFYRALSAEKILSLYNSIGSELSTKLYSKKTLKKIAEIFNHRSKQLGFKK